ncbi:MAG: hypothetical protein PHX18_06765 [Candidatus Gastranaerophilales bacterium]|nr:hypothetical protein [Candidatus Gastranaerophilales bacterium]
MKKIFKTKEERLPFIYQILQFYAQNHEIHKNLEKEFLHNQEKPVEKIKLCPFCQYDYEHFKEIKPINNGEPRFIESTRGNNAVYYFLIFSSIIMLLSSGLFFLLNL